eukprot:UN10812
MIKMTASRDNVSEADFLLRKLTDDSHDYRGKLLRISFWKESKSGRRRAVRAHKMRANILRRLFG